LGIFKCNPLATPLWWLHLCPPRFCFTPSVSICLIVFRIKFAYFKWPISKLEKETYRQLWGASFWRRN